MVTLVTFKSMCFSFTLLLVASASAIGTDLGRRLMNEGRSPFRASPLSLLGNRPTLGDREAISGTEQCSIERRMQLLHCERRMQLLHARKGERPRRSGPIRDAGAACSDAVACDHPVPGKPSPSRFAGHLSVRVGSFRSLRVLQSVPLCRTPPVKTGSPIGVQELHATLSLAIPESGTVPEIGGIGEGGVARDHLELGVTAALSRQESNMFAHRADARVIELEPLLVFSRPDVSPVVPTV